VSSREAPVLIRGDVGSARRGYNQLLFNQEAGRQTLWGPFAGLGAAAAWEGWNGGASVSVLSGGPAAEAGYRLVFGDHGLFLEPYLGWMAFFGARKASGAPLAFSFANGMFGGLSLGYRF
jgi:hypothetical protein